MGNLGDGVYAKGMERGMEQGIEQGAEKKLLENIRSLMETMKWTMEQAMAALQVPEEDWPKYADMIYYESVLDRRSDGHARMDG